MTVIINVAARVEARIRAMAAAVRHRRGVCSGGETTKAVRRQYGAQVMSAKYADTIARFGMRKTLSQIAAANIIVARAEMGFYMSTRNGRRSCPGDFGGAVRARAALWQKPFNRRRGGVKPIFRILFCSTSLLCRPTRRRRAGVAFVREANPAR